MHQESHALDSKLVRRTHVNHGQHTLFVLSYIHVHTGRDSQLFSSERGRSGLPDMQRGHLQAANGRHVPCIVIWRLQTRSMTGQGQFIHTLTRTLPSKMFQFSICFNFARSPKGDLERGHLRSHRDNEEALQASPVFFTLFNIQVI